MKVYAIILNTCLAISTGCLGASYMVAGYWLIIPVILAMAIFWMTTRRSISWSASSLLSVYVVLSIIGVTLNFSIYLLALGCTTALVCWDLAHFEQSLAGDPPHEIDARLERYHLQSLAAVIFTSLLLAFISTLINLQLPFGVTIILVLTAMGCLTFGWQYIAKQR